MARFEELIRIGGSIRDAIKVNYQEHDPWLRGQEPRVTKTEHVDWPAFVKWRANCASLLSRVVSDSSIHREAIGQIPRLRPGKGGVEYLISLLSAIKEDYDRGLLGDLKLQVGAEIAADYMGQAEALLAEGQTGAYDHVPAAVLAGAVLEKTLRDICHAHVPPIDVADPSGHALAMNGLIDALKKAGVFNELTAKQLRAWADIRNHSAHGRFDAFGPSDVELMIKGIRNFLADQAR
jgi:hypothetical protein